MADAPALDGSDILNLLDAIAVKSQKITESIKGTGETSTKHMKAAGEAVSGLDRGVSSLAKSLLGPVGLAAGFVAVAKSLDSFATGQLQLSNLARNTGFASSAVLQMQAQFQRAGMSAAEANQHISGLGSAFANISMLREGSPVLHELAEGSPKLAADLLKAKNNGEMLSAVMASYNRAQESGNTRWMLRLEQIFNTSKTGMQVWNDQLRDHIHLWEFTEAESRKYHGIITNVSNTLSNIGGSIAQKLVIELGKATGSFKDMDEAARKFATDFNTFFDEKILPYIRTTIREYRTLVGLIETAQKNFNQPKPPISKETWEKVLEERQRDALANRRGTEDFDIKGEMQSSGSRIKDFGKWLDQKLGTGKRSSLEDGGGAIELSARTHTEEDSNKQLHGIYDILQRQEIRETGGNFGVGARSVGPGGTPGTGALQSGLGGFRRGSEGAQSGAFTLGKSEQETAGIVADEWRKAGMSEAGIAGLMANIKSESNFNPTLRHPDQPKWGGEAHFAHGLYQEGGSEWNNYARWLKTNHPDADWKDPRLQSEFAAKNLKENYSATWRKMMEGSKEQAADAYLRGYLKPAAGFMAQRSAQYSRGVPGVSAYEGDRSKLDQSMRGAPGANGELNANIYFGNVPMGVRTNADGKGFKTLRVTSSKQGQQATEGLLGPGDGNYTQFVP